MNYSEAIQFLYSLQRFGAKFGLDNPRRLAALAGHPERELRFIHVAGTNGKGSTCAMLESIYRASGRRVGLFTSPHLVAFGERIQVNRRWISEADVARLMEWMQPLLATFPGSAHPTFFEVVTVMALKYFTEQKCDLVIWETGLGGRLDATNIVTPLASVITNIQFDHQQWLGDTLARIAAEKAGIIKPGIPVLSAADSPEARMVIEKTAQTCGSPWTWVSREDSDKPPLDHIVLPLLGEHQRLNAALALATVRSLASVMPVREESLRAGLESVEWPGRLQVLRRGAQTFLLDGAHNPAGAESLCRTLQHRFPETKPTLILGVMRDKDWPAITQWLAPLASRILTAPVQSDRTASAAELCVACRCANSEASITATESLAEALALSHAEAFVVVTGSLHFIGEALEKLGALPCPAAEERGLNDWTANQSRVER